MPFLVECFAAIIVLNAAFLFAFARLGTRPTPELPDHSGHRMQHALIEKCIAWTFASIMTIGFVAGVYLAWGTGNVGFAVYIIALGGPLGWLAFLYLRKQRNIIDLTASGIAWRRRSELTKILWTDVTGFSEAPSSTAWLVRAKDGHTLRVDKLLVGVPTTFVEYLRKHLQPTIVDAAFAYVRPKAALRARINKRSASI